MKPCAYYNDFQWWLKQTRFDEVRALNLLQDAGIISDNCILAADVANVNFPAAKEFLEDFIKCRICGTVRNSAGGCTC